MGPEANQEESNQNGEGRTEGEVGNNEPIQPSIEHDPQVYNEAISFPKPELLAPASGLRRNPPVTIEDWPVPDLDSDVSEDKEDADITLCAPLPGLEGDPKFVERQEPLGLDPNNEPKYSDQEMRQILKDLYGDIADEQWGNMYLPTIEQEDYITLQFLATRLRTHFSRQTYEDLRHGACEGLKLPSEFVAWRRLRILSGLESCSYDCCINSCCCFLGKYQDLKKCPYCNEDQYAANGRIRRAFRYTPLIPQLKALYLSSNTASDILYRTRAEKSHNLDVIQDVFDGANYRSLQGKQLSPDSEYHIFDHPNDLALGLSTDGFTLFKRRRCGHSTAWPIILVNYNLHPSIRTRLENVLCVGVIPGPTQCKDLNSFLIPLLDELLQLEAGIPSSAVMPQGSREGEAAAEGGGMDVDDGADVGAGVDTDADMEADVGEATNEYNAMVMGYNFVLQAFVIVVFGDIPAIAKLMCMKGHNSLTPCHACYIQGVLCRLRKSSVYYVPLMHPDDDIPTQQLYMRTHNLFILHLAELDLARQRTKVEFNRVSMEYGIKGSQFSL
ncbi:hypothetical protein BN14_12027 [Rhizoctonia solani AG-1 IB]|uniref:Transposase family Tnp2 protein n=1 Tax=Thanatephorus cucumeris (strain AG1-IB / isolate 7/3/14) TaxID=1108050 RepID=M5CHH3_THACB|nr:hypothetical protein BN14_12027 [Rhizoctonia solani AG-1 IB]